MPTQRTSHHGKVALITGGASGIGKASVLSLLKRGVSVVFADLNLETGAETLTELREEGFGERVRFFPCNVLHEADIEHAVRFTRETFGRFDYMVNNAGTGGSLGSLLDTTGDGWDKTQALLGRSVFLGIKHAARVMIEQEQGGSIISVSSIAAHQGGGAGAAYSAAKAGILNLTMNAASELARYKIRVNTVSPGPIITPLLVRDGDEEHFRAAAIKSQPWPEPGEPEDVASTIDFLLSDDARFITGTDILVDGGVSAQGINIFSGHNPIGNAMSDAIQMSKDHAFDSGSSISKNQQTSWEQQVANIDMACPDKRNEKRVVLITGVSRGLGLAMAEQLITMGHTVVGCARSEEAIADLRLRYGSPHSFTVVDITDDESVRQWIEELDRGDVFPDLVLNNAAIVNSPLQLWRLDAEEIENVIRVNLLGAMHVLRHIVPNLLKRRKGTIVNFSSGWGRDSAERAGPYCASKWAIEGLTRSLAKELPPHFAVVSLHPGIIRTESMEANFGEAAKLYASPIHWAQIAAPYLLSITSEDNGRELSVPGMTNFYGMGNI